MSLLSWFCYRRCVLSGSS